MLRAHVTEAAVPLHLAQCIPSRACPQSERCARCDDRLTDPAERVIDASVAVRRAGDWCALFLDIRGEALLPAHQTLQEAP